MSDETLLEDLEASVELTRDVANARRALRIAVNARAKLVKCGAPRPDVMALTLRVKETLRLCNALLEEAQKEKVA